MAAVVLGAGIALFGRGDHGERRAVPFLLVVTDEETAESTAGTPVVMVFPGRMRKCDV